MNPKTFYTSSALTKTSLLFLPLFALCLIGCQEQDKPPRQKDSSTPQPAKITSPLPDESDELRAFTEKANATCKKTQRRLQRSETVDLGSHFERYGIEEPFELNNYSKLPPQAVKEINQAGKKTKLAIRKIQQKRVKNILSLKIPEGQKANLDIWAKTVNASLVDPHIPTLRTKNNPPTKEALAVAAKQQTATLKADMYASLIGMIECRQGNRSRKTMKLLPLLIEYETFETQDTGKDTYKVRQRLGKVRLSRSSTDLVMKEKYSHQRIVFKLGGVLTDTKKGCYLSSLRNDLDKTFGSGRLITMNLYGREGYFKLSAKKEDQIILNTRLIIDGRALPDPKLRNNHPLKEVYQIAARVARSKKLGVWKKCEQEANRLSQLG